MARRELVPDASCRHIAPVIRALAGQSTAGRMTDLAGIELFHCERQHARLTTAACGRQWAKANGLTKDYRGRPYQVQPWESLFQCRGCQIGAGRNGRVVDPIEEANRALAKVCPRLPTAHRPHGERPW
jgi:hypothetical protein